MIENILLNIRKDIYVVNSYLPCPNSFYKSAKKKIKVEDFLKLQESHLKNLTNKNEMTSFKKESQLYPTSNSIKMLRNKSQINLKMNISREQIGNHIQREKNIYSTSSRRTCSKIIHKNVNFQNKNNKINLKQFKHELDGKQNCVTEASGYINADRLKDKFLNEIIYSKNNCNNAQDTHINTIKLKASPHELYGLNKDRLDCDTELYYESTEDFSSIPMSYLPLKPKESKINAPNNNEEIKKNLSGKITNLINRMEENFSLKNLHKDFLKNRYGEILSQYK